jgi:tyrosyl-tRNA synthetase
VKTRLHSARENPRDIKKELACKVVGMFHDEEEAHQAQTYWETQFSEGGVPEDIPEYAVESPTEIMDLLRETGMVQSGKEARRKIDEGAVQLDGKKIKEIKLRLTKEQLDKGVVVKVGRKMYRIKRKV